MENNKDQESQLTSNDPSKPMDSKEEVAHSNDAKIDQDFPGYPHYPAKEDMMDKQTHTHRVDRDMEEISSEQNNSGVSQRFPENDTIKKAENAMQPQPGSGNDDPEQ